MPNYCDFTIRVKGYKRNVDEFIKIIQYGYLDKDDKPFGPHMFRIFDSNVYNEEVYGIQKTAYISGYCAWSVYCCMMPGALSYYNENFENGYEYGTNLINESKRLNLFIEVCSEELGMEFGEYYRIDNGILCNSEEYEAFSIYPHWFDGDLDDCNVYIEDINKRYSLNIPLLTQEELDKCDEDTCIANCNPATDKFNNSRCDELCLNIMCELV